MALLTQNLLWLLFGQNWPTFLFEHLVTLVGMRKTEEDLRQKKGNGNKKMTKIKVEDLVRNDGRKERERERECQFEKGTGQSYKAFPIINYKSRVTL